MYLISSTVLFVLTFGKKRHKRGDIKARASRVQTDQFYDWVDLFEMKLKREAREELKTFFFQTFTLVFMCNEQDS